MPDLSYLAFQTDFSSPVVVSAYDELPLWSAMFGLLLLDEVPLSGVRRALDVGCGTGFPLIELAERLGSATSVHGIDPWSAAVARAAEKVRCRATPNVTLHEGSAASLPFDDASFDLIVSNLGLNNFDDRDAVIRECARVARSGAVLALTTNVQGHMQELYAIFEEVLAKHEPARIDALREHIEHRATVASVRALLENGGFAVRRVVERNATMRFASGSALLHHYFIKLGFLDGWKAVVRPHEEKIFPLLQQELDARGVLSLTIPMAYVEAVR
ncbi:MAG TPA: methyltransferase domain-containing protein [Thermoanaerobaculia bacterium]|nr:methyltransferase domain-containing protein [Thermoanaerobaculia bacterium]